MTHHLKDPDRLSPAYDEAYWNEVHHAAYVKKTRCRECLWIGYRHHPRCSKADPETKERWARREELRSLRTIGRIGG